jgi:hypothetical protein
MRVGSTSPRSVHASGFAFHCLLTPRCRLYPLPVRRASALPTASFRLPVARETLAVQLTLPHVGCVEDFHLQVGAPCRAHNEKGHPEVALFPAAGATTSSIYGSGGPPWHIQATGRDSPVTLFRARQVTVSPAASNAALAIIMRTAACGRPHGRTHCLVNCEPRSAVSGSIYLLMIVLFEFMPAMLGVHRRLS